MVLADLAEFTHFVTRIKVVPAVAEDVSLAEAERTRGRAFAAKLSMRVLARTWQMLLKGLERSQAAGRPLAAAEMVLVRIAYAADLPTPDEVDPRARRAARGDGSGAGRGAGIARPGSVARASAARRDARRIGASGCARRASVAAGGEPAGGAKRRGERAGSRPRSFEELIALAGEKRDLGIKSALERDVRLVRFEDGRIEIGARAERARRRWSAIFRRSLRDWTGRRWMVVVSARARRADTASAGAVAQGRVEGWRARRSAGAGRAGALSWRRDCRRAAAGVANPSPWTKCRSMLPASPAAPTMNLEQEPRWPIFLA